MQPQHPYETPFLLALLLAALASLLWLFSQFIPAILFAVLLATSSYPWYEHLSRYRHMNTNRAALLATLVALFIIFMPLSYLMTESARMGSEVFSQLQTWLTQQSPERLHVLEVRLLNSVPLPDSWQQSMIHTIEQQLPEWVQQIKALSLWTAAHLFSGISSFFGFIGIALFSLFFFYRDGRFFIQRIVNLSPLSNHLDYFILHRFSALSTILVGSVLGIAFLQGMSFALLMLVLGMPWLFLGLAYAVASFIPVIGGFLIWAPVALYFIIHESYWLALSVALFSLLWTGFIIDNLLRAYVIQKLSQRFQQQAGTNALDHTWLTLLSTFAGLLHFGMMGLVFGPMLAAMAITIFDVYEHKHRHLLDYS